MNASTLSQPLNETGRGARPEIMPGPATRHSTNGDTRPPVPDKDRRPLLKRALLWTAGVLGGAGVLALAGHWWVVGRFIENTDDAYVGGNVTVIAPEVSGFITKLAVEDNQTVHAGELLVQLDDRDYQAALEQAAAQETAARLNVGYTELRAPIDGTIGNRSAQVGAYATTGSQLISLIPAHGLWIDANFKEDQLARMKPGSPATVTVDSIPGKTFRGHVVSIAPATGAEFSVLPPENATGNFTKIVQRVSVRIVLDDESAAHGELRPGLSVVAKVDTRGK